ncbi:MAG: PIN domain-containing protein [Planctomycetaceae bacterium]|nr:PIN domain-containing protein [Planctomycetaceae bacterium]
MSTFILDACVAISMLVEENDTHAARALQADVTNQIHELIAPDSLPIEVAHALTRAERQGKLMVGEGQIAFNEFLATCPKLYPYFDYLDRAMQLSSRLRIGVFDCLYVALSEEQDCRVVTVDERFLELFPDQSVSLHSL